MLTIHKQSSQLTHWTSSYRWWGTLTLLVLQAQIGFLCFLADIFPLLLLQLARVTDLALTFCTIMNETQRRNCRLPTQADRIQNQKRKFSENICKTTSRNQIWASSSKIVSGSSGLRNPVGLLWSLLANCRHGTFAFRYAKELLSRFSTQADKNRVSRAWIIRTCPSRQESIWSQEHEL
jgi:hypothetical protein